jgi:hypothetical protein
LSLAVGLLIGSIAIAQSSEGSIFGQAKADVPVTITNLDGGASRTIKSDAAGNFALSKLQPGRYKIESSGVVREAVVSIGSGTQVLLSGQIEQVEVSANRGRSIIDVRSVESNTVFTQEQIRNLPVARDVNSVALLAPGVVKGDTGLGAGGIPSFGGASVAENGYYINGFDVTIAVYVDDLIIACTDLDTIKTVKLQVAERYKVKDMGEMDWYLGKRCYRHPHTVSFKLYQAKYKDNIQAEIIKRPILR